MSRPADQWSEDEYRQWLKALAQAVQSDESIPPPETESWGKRVEEASGFDPPSQHATRNHSKDSFAEDISSQATPEKTDLDSRSSVPAPRVWDLYKPYVLFVAVLLGGLLGIGVLLKLGQWLIPLTRPSVPSAPIEAQWEVERRGVHILPESQTAPETPEPSPSGAPTSYSP